MDLSVAGMRVLREVAERGSFTAAASALGYTQSAVSRQVAALESALGVPMFQRQRTGVRLTPAGRAVLRHATLALDEIDAALLAVKGRPSAGASVRLGAYASAGAVLLPRALATLRQTHPEIDVSTREATTPALVRAVRAGSLDLAVLASAPPFRAPDTETPELAVEVISEADLHIAVPVNHPLALDDAIDVERLHGQRWIASPASAGEVLLGVWPGLGGRSRIAHSTRDWLTKLHLVAAGCGITTIPRSMLPAVPEGIRVLPVRGGPRETRRVLLARMPGRRSAALRTVQEALRTAADDGSVPARPATDRGR
ncbi:MAG TPA: LysR family transcriptional regulator [Rugosimonospora sp.]|jgi:DNA-binding transcriptional LysR family regulator